MFKPGAFTELRHQIEKFPSFQEKFLATRNEISPKHFKFQSKNLNFKQLSITPSKENSEGNQYLDKDNDQAPYQIIEASKHNYEFHNSNTEFSQKKFEISKEQQNLYNNHYPEIVGIKINLEPPSKSPINQDRGLAHKSQNQLNVTSCKSSALISHKNFQKTTVLPYVRKFISKLKNSSVFRSAPHQNAINLSLLHDFVNFSDKKEKAHHKLVYYYENLLDYFDKIRLQSLSRLLLKCNFILHPYGNFKTLWNICHLILTIIWFFYIPLYLAFMETQNKPYEFQLYTISFLIFDIIVNLNTAFFKNGVVEQSRKKILKNYFLKHFFLDSITLISLILGIFDISENIQRREIDKYIKFLFFCKVFTLRKIMNGIFEKFLIKEQLQNIFSLFKVFFISILVAHIFACFWCSAAQSFSDSDMPNWISKMGLIDASWKTKYLYAIYWALVTMLTVGYGDITPQNNQEIIVCMVSVVLGCVVYAYNINSIGMILQNFHKEKVEFEHKINVINQFMKRKGIHGGLQMRIREYLRFIWKEEKLENLEEEHQIIGSLSQSLKEELLLQAYGGILKNHPMFYTNFSEKSLKKIVNIIKDVRLFPDEVLFVENDEDTNLYFVMKGKMELFMNGSKNNGLLLKNLDVGENFGEIEFFTGNLRLVSAKSRSFTTLLAINREEFLEILQKNPEDWEKFCMIRDQILIEKNYCALKVRCFCCNQIGHLAGNCSFLHFEADRERIIKSHVFYNDQERRKDHIRKNRRKNALKQKEKLISVSKKILEFIKERTFQTTHDEFMNNSDKSDNEAIFEEENKLENNEIDEQKIVDEIGKTEETNTCEEIKIQHEFGLDNKKIDSEIYIPKHKIIENVLHKKLAHKASSYEEPKHDNSNFRIKTGIPNAELPPKNQDTEICPLRKIPVENPLPFANFPLKKSSYEEPKSEISFLKNKARMHKSDFPFRRNQNFELNEGKIFDDIGSRKRQLPENSKMINLTSSIRIGAKPFHHVFHSDQQNLTINSEVTAKTHPAIKEMDNFEKVEKFKNYFPEGDVRFVIGRYNKFMIMKSARKFNTVRKSVEIRRKLGKYTFFVDEMKQKMPDMIKKRIKSQKRKSFLKPEIGSTAQKNKNTKNLSLESGKKFVDLVKYTINISRNKKKGRKNKK